MRIGVDIGGTAVKTGITDDNGKIIQRVVRKTGYGISAEKLKREILESCLSLTKNFDKNEIKSIGIGAPGTVDKQKIKLVYAPNLNVCDVLFNEIFNGYFDCPMYIDNDANCAALAELYQGSAKDVDDFIMVTLGTGIGGGIIINKKLYTGFNGIAGEIGHTIINVDGEQCNCGKKGCFETYCSSGGFVRLYTKHGGCENITAINIFNALDKGEEIAKEAFYEYIKYLSIGIGNIISFLQPEKIVIGGGLSGYGEKLLMPLRKKLEDDRMNVNYKSTQIVLATAGNDSGIIGSAMLDN